MMSVDVEALSGKNTSSASNNNLSEEEEKSPSASITSKGSSGLVKWLYPSELSSSAAGHNPPSASDEMSELATDQSIPGSSPVSASDDAMMNEQEEMQAQTSTSSGGGDGEEESTGGPDSDVQSVDELPNEEKGHVTTEELTQKVSASANYIGSIFSSAWTKTARTANDATANSSSFLSSAFTKVAGSTSAKTSPKDEAAKPLDGSNGQDASDSRDDNAATDANGMSTADAATDAAGAAGAASDDKPSSSNSAAYITDTASSFFSSAMSSIGSLTAGKGDALAATTTTTPAEGGDAGGQTGNGSATTGASMVTSGFTSAFSMVGKVATDATHVLKDKVTGTNIITEFNKEQDSFIKAKSGSHGDVGVAPWVGYQGEDELKAKILNLSEDKRNFVRAPPSGVSFEFEYASVSSVALALLQEDHRLEKMRYALVPKMVKEEEFWRNYFYRVSLIKQSFELKDLERNEAGEKAKKASSKAASKAASEQLNDDDVMSKDDDDEFVSDSYQASTSDLAEVDESMKRLGVSANEAEEWEAELEGELNEFEVVSDKNGGGSSATGGGAEENPEWESQIQDMLDAEEESGRAKK